MKNKIYPCLWFDGNAAEAARLYSEVFGNSSVSFGNQMVHIFESAGQKFMLLNGGPQFRINPSISFFVSCANAGEVDTIWNKLLAGGSVLMPLGKYDWNEHYGWLQDRFGVNWQLMTGKTGESEQRFIPALMYTGTQNGNAEKALNYYKSVFNGSEIKYILRYTTAQNEIAGNIAHAQFTLENQLFIAMDSSYQHEFTFNEAVSLVVECETQGEIDYLWEKLTEGGEESRCGWLRDRYGVSWQIIPSVLYRLMSDPLKADKVVSAFLQMKKFDIETLLKV